MTTPNSGQISIGDIKSELLLVGGANYDISLATAAADIMADGFADTYQFIYQTGFGTAPVNLSYFYSCQTLASYTFYTQSNITDYKDFQSTLDNNSLGLGVSGPNASPPSFRNPSSGIQAPGTSNSVNITHMQDLLVNVNCDNLSPIPPFAQIYMDYENPSTNSFPGSPFQGPAVNANTGVVSNTPNNVGTPVFTVTCYQ
jgi:hypothetical protein